MPIERKLKIFLSYASQDLPKVKELYDSLERDGFLPWMDKMDLMPGQDWDLAMRRAIRESDIVIACLSRSSHQKEGYIQTEYKLIGETAQEKPKDIIFVIPLRLEECEMPDLFRQYQWVDYFTENGYESLRRSLRNRAQQLGMPADSEESAMQSEIPEVSSQQDNQLPSSLDEIKKIRNEQQRARSLVALAERSPDENIFNQILAETRRFTNDLVRLAVLRELARYMPPGSDSLFQEALSIKEEHSRASVLVALVPHLDEELKPRVLDTAREIKEETARIRVLSALAPQLGEDLKLQVIQEAFSVLRQIQDENSIAIALEYLAPLLTDELLVEAGDLVLKIKDRAARVRAITALLPHLKDDLKSRFDRDDLVAAAGQPASSSSEASGEEDVIQPFSFEEKTLDKHAATDKPIQSVEQDKLGFSIYVTALHDFIASQYTNTPLTISIDGPWGSGKSSLMYMLKNNLEPQHNPWQRFVSWARKVIRWCGWFCLCLVSLPVQAFGGAMAWMALKYDKDDRKFHFRIGRNNEAFRSWISDIAKGLSAGPEALQQKDNELTPRAAWWAQVQANCRAREPLSHPTIWLNAWKFDNQEEVWASLALATLEQLKQKHNIFWMMWFRIRLTFKRLSFVAALGVVLMQFVLPVALGVAAVYYDVIINSFEKPFQAFKNIPIDYGSYLFWAGAVITGILTVSSVFKDPFQIPVDRVFDRPSYKEKVGFLTRFEKDFSRIVDLATRNGFGWKKSKLIIFVDDLDRCEPPKAADIVEAVNLFLDAEGCVFVMGMDSESVAMSIEAKYKELFTRMKSEKAGVVSLGRAFLEKIVQVPFTVPRTTSTQIMEMVESTLETGTARKMVIVPPPAPAAGPTAGTGSTGEEHRPPEEEGRSEADKQGDRPEAGKEIDKSKGESDPASFARTKVRQAIRLGTELLNENPRQVKTFVNLFRLSIYIANARGFFEAGRRGDQFRLIGLDRLAIWVACSVRWQNLIRHLYIETQMNSLCIFLNDITKNITPEYQWTTGNKNIPTKLRKKIETLRKGEKGSEAHWCHLPWDWWLLEPDFLQVVKRMEDLWVAPAKGEADPLKVLLNMSKPLRPTAGSTEAK